MLEIETVRNTHLQKRTMRSTACHDEIRNVVLREGPRRIPVTVKRKGHYWCTRCKSTDCKHAKALGDLLDKVPDVCEGCKE